MGSASSRTRERLREAELERDDMRKAMLKEKAHASEMRRVAEEQQALAERLKREGTSAAAGMSAFDVKVRMHELEQETKAARAEKRAPVKGLFRSACSTDVLFLLDTTGSMHCYIDAAKKQILNMVNSIKTDLLDGVDVRIAVVGYKDHCDHKSIEAINFTKSVNDVTSFLGSLTASGGNDTPEDVLGGLQKALNLSWQQQTRCIVHIADAPAHGNNLNTCSDDVYPYPGSEPHRLTYKPLIKKMISLNINYTFLRITDETDLMTFKFLNLYMSSAADGELDPKNRYYEEACKKVSSASCASSVTVKGGLRFEEKMLGTDYSALQKMVVSTVTSSAARTAVRLSSIRSRNTRNRKSPMTRLASLGEDRIADEATLDTSPPQWHTSGWLDERVAVEGFSPNVLIYGTGTLDEKMASDDNIILSVSELTVVKRSIPFAQGALRIACYARTAASDQRYVVKSFKRRGQKLPHLVEDMRSQVLCKAFALEFNTLTDEEKPIDFIATSCFKGKSDAADDCLSLEPYIRGTYVKYNGNSGWVNESNPRDHFSEVAQAFSHFTFERSQGRFLVCDLQGVGCILTDPAIHTRDPERFKLTSTNLNDEGFKLFFLSHKCNAVCTKLQLQSHRSMFSPGGFLAFRTNWPPMTRTTCCSNKLCARIIHINAAHRSEEYPGHEWCTTCWTQLTSSRKRWLCIAEGETDHEFDVSPFFWESQGRKTPRKCARHRGDEERMRVYREDLGWRATSSSMVVVPLARMPSPQPYVPPSSRFVGGSASAPRGTLGKEKSSSSVWTKKVRRSFSSMLLGG
jgi:hypothetical protein